MMLLLAERESRNFRIHVCWCFELVFSFAGDIIIYIMENREAFIKNAKMIYEHIIQCTVTVKVVATVAVYVLVGWLLL